MMRNRHTRILLATALAVLGLTVPAKAQFNPTITYQGFLSDDEGSPISDPSATLQFALRDLPLAGEILWTETHPSVPIEEGLFTVELGTFSPFDDLSFAQDLFLQITVGEGADGVTLAPLIPLTAVGYSLQSGSLKDGALVAGDNVTIEKVDGALQISADAGEAELPSSLVTPDGTTEAVTTNFLRQVGIGTAPGKISATLHVRSKDIQLFDGNTLGRDPDLAVEAEDALLGVFSSKSADVGSAISLAEMGQGQLADQWMLRREPSTDGSSFLLSYGISPKIESNQTFLAVDRFGFMGLGTTTPEGLLHLRTDDDAFLIIEADANKDDPKHNPKIEFSQDGGSVDAFIGLEGPSGGTASGTLQNALMIGSEDSEPVIQFVTNDKVNMTIGKDGSVTGSPRSHVYHVAPLDLVARDSELEYVFTGLFAMRTFGQPGNWRARVNLPHGAVMTKVTSRWSDFETPEDVEIRLVEFDPGTLDTKELAILDSSGANGVGSTSVNLNATFDERKLYAIDVEFPKGFFLEFEFRYLTIEYTTTQIH